MLSPSEHTTHSWHRGHETLHAVVLQPRPICCLVIFPGKINPKLTEALDFNSEFETSILELTIIHLYTPNYL